MDSIPKSELPIVCAKCYGSTTKVVKHEKGEECKICTRPFTVYRWQNRQLSANKTKKTIICHTCARVRNCCQSCMLDIEFGIPLEVRDAALKMAGLEIPKYGTQTNNMELKQVQATKQEEAFATGNQSSDLFSKARDLLAKLAKKLQERNLTTTEPPQVDSKAEKGNSSSASDSSELSKLALKYPFRGTLQKDESNGLMKGVFFFGFPTSLPQYTLEDYLKKYGRVKLLTVVHKARCAFALFAKQEAADSFSSSVLSNDFNCVDLDYPGLILLDGKYPMRVSRCNLVSLGASSDIQKKLAIVAVKELQNLAAKDVKRKQKAQPNGTKTQVQGVKRSGSVDASAKRQPTKKAKFNVDVEL